MDWNLKPGCVCCWYWGLRMSSKLKKKTFWNFSTKSVLRFQCDNFLLEFPTKSVSYFQCFFLQFVNVKIYYVFIVIKVSARNKISRMLTLKVLKPKVGFQQQKNNKEQVLIRFHCVMFFTVLWDFLDNIFSGEHFGVEWNPR